MQPIGRLVRYRGFLVYACADAVMPYGFVSHARSSPIQGQLACRTYGSPARYRVACGGNSRRLRYARHAVQPPRGARSVMILTGRREETSGCLQNFVRAPQFPVSARNLPTSTDS